MASCGFSGVIHVDTGSTAQPCTAGVYNCAHEDAQMMALFDACCGRLARGAQLPAVKQAVKCAAEAVDAFDGGAEDGQKAFGALGGVQGAPYAGVMAHVRRETNATAVKAAYAGDTAAFILCGAAGLWRITPPRYTPRCEKLETLHEIGPQDRLFGEGGGARVSVLVSGPFVLILATAAVEAAFRSPMDMELALLDALCGQETPQAFAQALSAAAGSSTADGMLMAAFYGFDSYAQAARAFDERRTEMKRMCAAMDATGLMGVQRAWQQYGWRAMLADGNVRDIR